MNQLIVSLNKNKKGIYIILISAFFTAIGQYFWKLSAAKDIHYILIGFFCYGIGAIGMILAFRYGSFSVIHPMISTNYIFAFIIAYYFLGEQINTPKILGLVFIMIGVLFLGVGDE